jgi:arylsulfatase
MSEDNSGKNPEIRSRLEKAGIRRRHLLLGTTSLVAASALGSAAGPRAAAAATSDVLPDPEPPFKGKIGRTVKDSTPDFPKSVEAPADAPNVLLILTDDVGFGATSTFGGPIQTPTFSGLPIPGSATTNITPRRSARPPGRR